MFDFSENRLALMDKEAVCFIYLFRHFDGKPLLSLCSLLTKEDLESLRI